MSAASEYRHVDEIARLTRERDAAIAQRDRAVEALKPFSTYDVTDFDDFVLVSEYGEFTCGDIRRARAIVSDTPIPDRLAAEREAGRKEKAEFEAAAKKIYEGFAFLPGYVPWVEGGNSDKQEEARQLVRRALRDTSAEGGE